MLQPLRTRPTEGGFTLVEILVVVAIIALVARIVTANLGALIPSTVLDAEAGEIMGALEYMRSEAQLQGKSFTFEFDLERNRWRIVLPAEDRLLSTDAIGESMPLGWKHLDERVRFGGLQRLDGHTARSGVAKLVIDENGYTTDSLIYLRNRAEQLEYNVWTIRIFGLEPRSRLLTNNSGEEPQLEIVEEHRF